MSPVVDHHDLRCGVHIPDGVVVAAIVGVCAVVARWDVVSAIVAVVVTWALTGCHGLLS